MSLVIFISTYSVGWGPLPWAIMGEMFAPSVKAKAASVTVSVCWLLAFIITKFSSNITDSFGNYTTYWLFDICCILSILFTVFLLPETKGKSLQEIQDELNGVESTSLPHFDNGTKTDVHDWPCCRIIVCLVTVAMSKRLINDSCYVIRLQYVCFFVK